ncbi:Poly [ADP-ribose] polymerase tankyrase [Gryllus bimaculatus]|nr:Poly [ADP-ribose] polymerase tankyrase [Gryllus bimaculatus]
MYSATAWRRSCKSIFIMTAVECDSFQKSSQLEPCDYAVKLAGLAYLRAKKRKDVSFVIHIITRETEVKNFVVMHLHWLYKEHIRQMTYLVALIDSEDQIQRSEGSSGGGNQKCLQDYGVIFKEIVEDLKVKQVKIGDRLILTKKDDFSVVLFCGQAEVTELDSIVQHAFRMVNKDPFPKPEIFLFVYFETVKEMCQQEFGLMDNAKLIEQVVANSILKDFRFRSIDFWSNYYEELESRLNRIAIMYIIIPGVRPDLRCCKVINAMYSLYGLKFVVLTEEHIATYPMSWLSLVFADFCEALVMNVDNIAHPESFLEQIGTSKLKNIVAVSSAENPRLRRALLSLGRTYKQWTDVWSLEDVDDLIQELLMFVEISFQGRVVTLSQLETTWPWVRASVSPPMLDRLVTQETVTIGVEPPPHEIAGVRDRRTFRHKTILKPEVLQMDSEKDVIMITGVPKKTFNQFFNPSKQAEQESDWMIAESSLPTRPRFTRKEDSATTSNSKAIAAVYVSKGVDIGYDKRYNGEREFLKPPAPKMYKNVFVVSYAETMALTTFGSAYVKFKGLQDDNPDKNVHWISYESGHLVWIKTHGSEENLVKYIDRLGSECSEMPVCVHNDDNNHFSVWKTKIIQVVGDSGMGKTTLLKKTYYSLFNELTLHWVIYVNFSDQKQWLEQISADEITICEVVEFLLMVAKCDSSKFISFSRDFLFHSIEKSGKCVLFFDGLERLEKKTKEAAICLMKKVSETKVEQMWVGTTGRDSIRIKEVLKAPPIELMYVQEKDQMNYIRFYWNQENNFPVTHQNYNSLVKLAVDVAPKLNGISMLSVPLHLCLFAESELPEDDENEALLDAVFFSLSIELPDSSIFMLYRKYIKTRLSSLQLKGEPADSDSGLGIRELEDIFFSEDFVPKEYPAYSDSANLRVKELENILHSTAIVIKPAESDTTDVGIKELEDDMHSTAIVPKEQSAETLSIKKLEDSSSSTSIVSSSLSDQTKAHQLGDSIIEKANEFVDIVARQSNRMLHESFTDYLAANCFAVYHKILGPSYLKEKVLPSDNATLLYFFNAVFCVGLPLHDIALSGADVDVAKLVDNGCRVDELDLGGRAALHLAALYDRAGADVTIRDSVLEWTPLQYASFSNSLEIVELLLGRGADSADLTDLLERARAENVEIDEKRRAILDRLRATRPLAQPKFFAVSPQLLDPTLLGLTEELVNNSNDCFNDAPYICTLDLSKPPVLPLPRAVYKGLKNLAKILVENGVGDPGLFSVSALHLAAYYGRKDIMRMLLFHGMYCDLCKHDGRTPLHVACQKGDVEVGKVLLKRGAAVNARDVGWRTPTMLAAEAGSDLMLQELLRKDPETVHVRDQLGRSALYYAAKENHSKCVKTLLDAGASVYVTDKFETSAMQAAIARGHFDTVCVMYPFADPTELRDIRRSTPLHHAVAYDNLDIVVGLLVRRHPVNLADRDGVTPLHIAAKRANLKIFGMLLSRGADPNLTDSNNLNCLHYAALGGNEAIVKKLLRVSAQGDLEKNLKMCVIISAICGHVLVLKALLEGGAVVDPKNPSDCQLLNLANTSKNPEMTRTLLEMGLNPNLSHSSSELPALHLAIIDGAVEIVAVLLENGADVNATLSNGTSPLHTAVKGDNVKLIELLLSHGANPNILDNNFQTPTYIAAERGNVEALDIILAAHGLVENTKEHLLTALHFATKRNRIDVIDFLLSKGANVNTFDKNGLPLLNFACLSRSNFDTILHLISKGADSTFLDSVNRNALHHAAMSGKSSVVKLLVTLGLDINSPDSMNCTPLHIAAFMGVSSSVKILLENGADINLRDIRGRVPLDEAFIAKKKDIVYMFLKFGANLYSVLFSELGKTIRQAFTDFSHPIFQWNEIIEFASKLPERTLRSKYLTLVSPKRCLPGSRKAKTYKITQVAQLLPEEYLGPIEHLTYYVDSGKINPALLKNKKLQNPLLHERQKTPIMKALGPSTCTSTGSTPRRTPPVITPRAILANGTPTITPPPISPRKLVKGITPEIKPKPAPRNLQKLEASPGKPTTASHGASGSPKAADTSMKSTSTRSPSFDRAILSPVIASSSNTYEKPSKRSKSLKKKRGTQTESSEGSSAKMPMPTSVDANENEVKGVKMFSVENYVKSNVSMLMIRKSSPKCREQVKDSNESVTRSEMTCKDATKLKPSKIANGIDKETSSASKGDTKKDSQNSTSKAFQGKTVKVSPAVMSKSSLAKICSDQSAKNVLEVSKDISKDSMTLTLSESTMKSTLGESSGLEQAIYPSVTAPSPNTSQKLSKQSKSHKKKRGEQTESTSISPSQKASVETREGTNASKIKGVIYLSKSSESITKSKMTSKNESKLNGSKMTDRIPIAKGTSNNLKEVTEMNELYSPSRAYQDNVENITHGMTPQSSHAIVGSKTGKNILQDSETRIGMAESFKIAPTMLPDDVLHELQTKCAEKFASLEVSDDYMPEASQMSSREMAEIITNYYKEGPSPEKQSSPKTPTKKNKRKNRKAASSKHVAVWDSPEKPSKSAFAQDPITEPNETMIKDLAELTMGVTESSNVHMPILPCASRMKSPKLEAKWGKSEITTSRTTHECDYMTEPFTSVTEVFPEKISDLGAEGKLSTKAEIETSVVESTEVTLPDLQNEPPKVSPLGIENLTLQKCDSTFQASIENPLYDSSMDDRMDVAMTLIALSSSHQNIDSSKSVVALETDTTTMKFQKVYLEDSNELPSPVTSVVCRLNDHSIDSRPLNTTETFTSVAEISVGKYPMTNYKKAPPKNVEMQGPQTHLMNLQTETDDFIEQTPPNVSITNVGLEDVELSAKVCGTPSEKRENSDLLTQKVSKETSQHVFLKEISSSSAVSENHTTKSKLFKELSLVQRMTPQMWSIISSHGSDEGESQGAHETETSEDAPKGSEERPSQRSHANGLRTSSSELISTSHEKTEIPPKTSQQPVDQMATPRMPSTFVSPCDSTASVPSPIDTSLRVRRYVSEKSPSFQSQKAFNDFSMKSKRESTQKVVSSGASPNALSDAPLPLPHERQSPCSAAKGSSMETAEGEGRPPEELQPRGSAVAHRRKENLDKQRRRR